MTRSPNDGTIPVFGNVPMNQMPVWAKKNLLLLRSWTVRFHPTNARRCWGSRVRVGYSRSGQPSKTYELHGNTPHDPTGEIRSMSA